MPQLVIATGQDRPTDRRGGAAPAVAEAALSEHADLTALAFLVARAPSGLDVHVERLERAADADGDQVYGALVDLFLVTGAEEAELRRQLLTRFGDRLAPDHRAALAEAVAEGFAPPAAPAPPSRHSVLDPGTRVSIPLVTPADVGAAPPRPAARAVAVTAGAAPGPRRRTGALVALAALAAAVIVALVAAGVAWTRSSTPDEPARVEAERAAPSPTSGVAPTVGPTVTTDGAPVLPETADPTVHAEAVVRTWAWLLAHPDPGAPDGFLVPGTPAHSSLRRTLTELSDTGRGVRLVGVEVGAATRRAGPDGTVAVRIPVRWSGSEAVDLATGRGVGDRPLLVDELVVEVVYPEPGTDRRRAVDVRGLPLDTTRAAG